MQTYKLIAHSEPEGHRPFQCLMHTSTYQENALRHQLCQGAPGFLEHSNTLTPMHEIVRKHSWDDNSHEPKIKGSQMSQSTPGLSNLQTVGKLEVLGSDFGMEAADDLRKCIPSPSSAANVTINQPDIAGFVLRENKERELFQENSDTLSNELGAVLHQRDYVPYLSSSIETTPERTSIEQACDYTFQGDTEVEYKTQNLRPWDIASPGSPSYPPLSDIPDHLKTCEYSTQSMHILDSSQSQNNKQAHPGTSPTLQSTTSTMIDPISLHSNEPQSGKSNTAREMFALKPDEVDVSDDKKHSLHSTQSRHSNTPQNKLSPVLHPLDTVEQATDEVVTTFDYDSDESNHALQTSFDDCVVASSSATTVASTENILKHGSVSPWHDKNRKIRINPPRVLKVSNQLPTTSERYLVEYSAPGNSTTNQERDKLRQSRSCSEMNLQNTESGMLHASEPSQVSHDSSVDTASERVLEKYL